MSLLAARTTDAPDPVPDPAMRWYPLLRRIAREVRVTGAPSPDLLTLALYAAYFHGHSDRHAWPPRTDAGTLRPATGPDEDFVAEVRTAVPDRHRRLLTRRLNGYFTVHGGAASGRPSAPTVRLYLNLNPQDAPRVFARVAARLDASRVAYAAKLLGNPADYGRPDAAVVYGARTDASRLARLVAAACSDAALGPHVPAFTREVAPGIAIADDPPDGVSFGLHRCGLIARGLLEAAGDDAHERLGAMIDALLRAGVDPARPHLAPGAPELEL